MASVKKDDRPNKYNPKNAASPLFKSLTRLFSGPIVTRKKRLPTKRKKRDYSKYRFDSAQGMSLSQRRRYDPFTTLQANKLSEVGRVERYLDFEQMEVEPILAAALDTYADEMTISNSFERVLRIECKNEEIKAILDELFYNILNVQTNLHPWCRSVCKYGDFFLYLDIEEGFGIKSVIALPPQEIERIEGEDESNPNYIVFQWNANGGRFENWQVCHFKFLANDKYTPYGTSVLDGVRRTWRQLVLMEDWMMSYRMERSSERRIFFIDVGAVDALDVDQVLQQQIDMLTSHGIVDPNTGKVDRRYNPAAVADDIYIPVRGDSKTRIEQLSAGQITGDIDDVKYLQDKLFTGIRIPQEYLSYTGEGGGDKQTLSQKDIRFAKIIQRQQRAMIEELEKMAMIHLHTLGFRGTDLTCFDLRLNNPSKLAEMQEIENWKIKFDVLNSAPEGMLSSRFMSEKFLELSPKEFERNQIESFYDAKYKARLEAFAEMAAQGAAGSQGEKFSDMDGIGEEEGMPEDNDPVSDEDNPLLAAPGKRDSDEYTTPGAKGKMYKPEASDSRDVGAFRRSMRSRFSHEKGSSARRNMFPGGTGIGSMLEDMQRDVAALDGAPQQDREEKLLNETQKRMESLREIERKSFRDSLPEDLFSCLEGDDEAQ